MKNFEILIKNKQIVKRIKTLAKSIDTKYQDEPIVLICVLKGAIVFYAELLKYLKSTNIELDFIQVKSYEGVSTTGNITLLKDVNTSLKDKNVILVEDIVDTGITANWLYKHFIKQQPKSLLLCSLLQKPSKLQVDLEMEVMIAFNIEDKFIIGYGLDLDQKYRNLQDIYVLKN